MNCYKEGTDGLFCTRPHTVVTAWSTMIRSFTVMEFAMNDLAVRYVFRQDELGKLSDVNS
jgi:hypothetical protein